MVSRGKINSMWKFNKGNLTLKLITHPKYEVDLERCNTSVEVLDWIIQVSRKVWATDEMIGSLVRQMDRCLAIQENICGCGVDKPFNARKWLLSTKGREHRYLTDEVLTKYLKKRSKGCAVVSVEAIMEATKDALRDMQ